MLEYSEFCAVMPWLKRLTHMEVESNDFRIKFDLKRLEILWTNDKVNINESDADDTMKVLERNLTSCKLQPNEDIPNLFTKNFDSLADYEKRKRHCIETKKWQMIDEFH